MRWPHGGITQDSVFDAWHDPQSTIHKQTEIKGQHFWAETGQKWTRTRYVINYVIANYQITTTSNNNKNKSKKILLS